MAAPTPGHTYRNTRTGRTYIVNTVMAGGVQLLDTDTGMLHWLTIPAFRRDYRTAPDEESQGDVAPHVSDVKAAERHPPSGSSMARARARWRSASG
ncbi:hypothetical protein J2X63_002654 [Agromyces sp. 3263]|nr:hypothetical protein [Agromyces sp. 3263]